MTQEQTNRICELFLAGYDCRDIAAIMNLPESTIFATLLLKTDFE